MPHPMRSHLFRWTGALATGLLFFTVLPCAWASPIVPSRDDEVIEVLPAVAGNRAEERRLRQQLQTQPRDATLALSVAKRYLDQAHELGDPRFAGLAMAAIQGWPDDATAPSDVLMMKATLQQYLHDFDASVETLKRLLARPGGAGQAQAWLTLATVRRVQGRYAESDDACRQIALSGAELHANACLAENEALRGHTEAARTSLNALLATPGIPVATASWLTTTLAELEQRDGRAPQAHADFRAALRLQPDAYAKVAYADFLIDQGRFAEVLKLLKDEVRTDAVVLRLAIAGSRSKSPSAQRDVAEMRDRIALANQRPDARKFHGREQAMFALWVDRQPALAVDLAKGNLEQQREAIDVLVFAEAARASAEPANIEEARRLKASIGLHDRRIDALL
jgi:tetratricopeptide (TPR) repeat protein